MRRFFWRVGILLASATSLGAQRSDAGWDEQMLTRPGVVLVEYIFESAPHPQCHASTIVETPAGLVAAWFGGTEEKHPDVGIWLSRHTDDQWTPPVEVANGIQYSRPDGSVHRHPCWNPVLFRPRQGPLLLFYKCGPHPKTWWGMLMTSRDDGKSWSVPRRLPEGILGPVKNKPVEVPGSVLVCPSSTEHDGWQLHLELTRDLGETWTRIGPLNDGRDKGAIQPCILFRPNGHWQMLARDKNRQGNIWSTTSGDVGNRWSELHSTGLPNPSSGIDAVTLADRRHLLIYNHTRRTTEHIGDSRSALNVAVSDDGERWQAALVLEHGDGDQEYSYPAVIQTSDGLVHVTYTWRRERIKHVVLEPAQLQLRPIVDGQWPAETNSSAGTK